VLFQALNAEITRFMLPLFFSRFTLPVIANETRQSRVLCGFIVGLAAFVNMKLRASGHMDDYAILFGVQASSYLFLMARIKQPDQRTPVACSLVVFVFCVAKFGCSTTVLRGLYALFVAGFCYRGATSLVANKLLAMSAACAGGCLSGLIPWALSGMAYYFFPVKAIHDAFQLISVFVGRTIYFALGRGLFLHDSMRGMSCSLIY
jgi:hypothetical protein